MGLKKITEKMPQGIKQNEKLKYISIHYTINERRAYYTTIF